MDDSQSKYLEVEVQDDDHLPVAGLEDGVLDVVVQNVHFVAPDWGETETYERRKKRLWIKKYILHELNGRGVLPASWPLVWASSEPCILFWAMLGLM